MEPNPQQSQILREDNVCGGAVFKFVDVEGTRIRYTDQGTGTTPYVLIHGASANLCDMQIALADKLVQNHRVLVFDRPGLGDSERPTDGHLLSVQARLIAKAIDKLGVEKSIVLGHSLGGAVSLALALDHPDIVERLVLLSTVSHPWPGGVDWYHYVSTAPIAGQLFRHGIVPLVGPYIGRSLSGNGIPNNYYTKAQMTLLFDPKTFRANSRDLVTTREQVSEMSKRYSKLSVPVLVITGSADLTVSPEIHSKTLAAEIPHSELLLFDGAGHLIQHSHSWKILAAIENWIAADKV